MFSGKSQTVKVPREQEKDEVRDGVKRESVTEGPCAQRFGTGGTSKYAAGGNPSRS